MADKIEPVVFSYFPSCIAQSLYETTATAPADNTLLGESVLQNALKPNSHVGQTHTLDTSLHSAAQSTLNES